MLICVDSATFQVLSNVTLKNLIYYLHCLWVPSCRADRILNGYAFMLSIISNHELLTHLLLYSIFNMIYKPSYLLRLISVKSEDEYLPAFRLCAVHQLLKNITTSSNCELPAFCFCAVHWLLKKITSSLNCELPALCLRTVNWYWQL